MLRTPPLALLLVATGCGARTPAPAPVLTAPASAAPASAAPATSALGGPAGGAPSLTALADARGLAVPGKVVPDDLTLTWSKEGGNIVNCRSYVRVDEVEGDKTLSACDAATTVAADGNATPWKAVATTDYSTDFSTYAVAADSDRQFFHVRESTLGTAVGGCNDSHTGFAAQEHSLLPACELWAPHAFRAKVANGSELFFLSGIDTEKFGIAYEHYQGGSGTNPWQLPPAQRLFVQGTGDSPTVTKLNGSYPVDAIAASGEALTIVGRADRAASGDDRITAALLPFVGTTPAENGATTLVLAAGKSDFGRPTVAAADGGFLVVWSERPRGTKPYHLAGARISKGSGSTPWRVEALGVLTTGPSAFAPGLASAGGRTALTYTVEADGASEVRFSCGTGDLKTLAANAVGGIGASALRRQDSEVALSDDGATGLLAWHEFSKKTQEVRLTPFTCGAR
jgi:hypothetical protein